jgi:hypothetical protein
MQETPASPTRRTLSLQNYRKALADKPRPGSVLGRVCSKRHVFTLPWAGLPPYQIDPCIVDRTAVFIESAPMTAYRVRRNLVAIPTIVMLITGGMLGTLLLSGSFTVDDVLLWAGTVLAFGLVTAGLTLLLTWFAWQIHPWPLVIRRHQGRLIARHAGRPAWCDLDDLSPAFAVGSLQFVSDPRNLSPIKPKQLPKQLQSRDQVAWLRLEWEGRLRWLILGIHEREEEALADLVRWGERLELDPVESQAAETPPKLAILSRNRRLF